LVFAFFFFHVIHLSLYVVLLISPFVASSLLSWIVMELQLFCVSLSFVVLCVHHDMIILFYVHFFGFLLPKSIALIIINILSFFFLLKETLKVLLVV